MDIRTHTYTFEVTQKERDQSRKELLKLAKKAYPHEPHLFTYLAKNYTTLYDLVTITDRF